MESMPLPEICKLIGNIVPPDTAYVHESLIATREQVMVEGKQVFFGVFQEVAYYQVP